MREFDTGGVTVTDRGVEVGKSLDADRSGDSVVAFTLRSTRAEPVETRLADSIPASVPPDVVELDRRSGAGVWRVDGDRLVFECWLDPGVERTTSYRVRGDADVASRPPGVPDLAVTPLRLGGWDELWRDLYPWGHGIGVVVLGYLWLLAVSFLVEIDLFLGLSVSGVTVAIALAGMWKVFAKAGHAGWKAVVPIYNLYVMLRIGGNSRWWLLGLAVPVVNVFVLAKIVVDVGRKFGRSVGFGLGLLLLWFVFWPVLGFGEDGYRADPYRNDRDRVRRAVEWRGNVDSPAFATATASALRSEPLSTLSVPKLQYAIEAVDTYGEVGAVDIDFEGARRTLRSAWEAKTGTDWTPAESGRARP